MKTWADIIADLRAGGMTHADIGAAVGLAPSTIGDLATGRSKSPRGAAAVKLHDLHRRGGPPRESAAPAREVA